MDMIVEFFKSDVGVSISWLCTVIGTVFGIVKAKENKELRVKVGALEVKLESMGNDNVALSGDGNVYTKRNSGGMTINM